MWPRWRPKPLTSLIVLEDAHLDEAVKAAAFGAFMNQGQICMSTERIIVEDTIADAFVMSAEGGGANVEYMVNRNSRYQGALRYNSISGDLRFNGPLGEVATGTQDWWDPIVGTQLSLPLAGENLNMDGRFYLGGFGVGSDLTWQLFPSVNWRFNKAGSLRAGYRWLSTDYETGRGFRRFKYDVVTHGLQVGFSFHF